ncbi:MAG TPA: hypothetical protein VFT72_01585 [Opitutaceae bacterium]|nr:hypothetical protein [Opitutaceae bacterium]
MALWEYKVITSGQHGFASPALLETHLNTLGKDEWEIIHFQTLPNNPLAFHGLARRSTMRDWTPPPEAAVQSPPRPAPEPIIQRAAPAPSAVKPEIDAPITRPEEKTEAAPPVREETLRPMRDTERDLDPDAEDEEDDWDNWEEDEDDLPTLFEALKPHMRRNQKGPGMSVAVDYLAKRWEQREADLVGALKECGFTIPETEESDPDYFEFEGDLYWVNRNTRGQLFINTREKPRPVFRTAQAKKLDPNDPATAELTAERATEKAEIEKRKAERAERAERQAAHEAAKAAAAAAKEKGPAISDQEGGEPVNKENAQPVSNEPPQPLPTGEALLDRIRPLMRRNRRGPGYSGSVGFLARALRSSEADLVAGLAALGLNVPAAASDKPVNVEIGPGIYWMNKDSRGGVWINGREKREGAGKPNGNGEPREGAAAENAGEPVPPMMQKDPAVSELPPREIVPQTAEVSGEVKPEETKPRETAKPEAAADQPVEGAAPQTAEVSEAPKAKAAEDGGRSDDSKVSEGESAKAEESATGTAESTEKKEAGAAEGEEEAAKPAKAKTPRRTASRPRTRKAKADAETSDTTPVTPENPTVPESETAKTDDVPKESS